MIFNASQRSGAAKLARHLLNTDDNEHVSLHELRGFVAEDDLLQAFNEAEAIAKGTRCQQFLFSLSLSPPETEHVAVETFETAIEMIEQKLGLDGQPRAIVFHEKEGRRHAHAVWSRIDAETMKAINLPYFKNKLMDVSEELYLEHGWAMPKGVLDRATSNPLNFTLAEWQQAKRANADPRLIKAVFRDAWQASDNAESLENALAEKGYTLARGDRRGVVAVDYRGEVYALARWSGVKTKDVKTRISDPESLPAVADTKAKIAARMGEQLRSYAQEIEAGYCKLRPSTEYQRQQMMGRHRDRRAELETRQAKRKAQEAAQRAARLPKGMSGIWNRITGRYCKIKRQNELDTWQAYRRDVAERDALIARQLDERRKLQDKIRAQRVQRDNQLADLQDEIAAYLLMRKEEIPSVQDFNQHSGATKKIRTRDRDRDHDGPDFEL